MISVEVVEAHLPDLLLRESSYGDTKYQGINPVRNVPIYGFEGASAQEMPNYLQRYNLYLAGYRQADQDDGARLLALRSNQALLKFMTSGRILVRAFESHIKGTSYGLADQVVHSWVKYRVFNNGESALLRGPEHVLGLEDRMSLIDTLVAAERPLEASAQAKDLFVAAAQFCVPLMAGLGYLPEPGDSSEEVSEFLPTDGIQQLLL